MDKKNMIKPEFNLSEEAKEKLKKIIDFILEDGKVEITDQDDTGMIVLEIKTENPAIIIGRHGHTLDAIQHLVNILSNRKFKEDERKKIIIDIEDYRAKRKDILTKYALEKADIVKKYNKEIALCFMNAAERRIIHVVLQEDPLVNTYSEGTDPYRKVIIKPQ
ncbi:MAG: KH domain-containing protein [Candidatus Caldatribacteriota bacterium]|nr:KH domain-containing protein [Candidatus Caldatribacteriota bacterium]